ncbi:glycosyltransferase family 4 protein [Modicisalibacter sp. 'Wilcox']|uniref:glycosyltransferase family 4 protein n=1 Tax=Modicisalibacter sp. 'Wilcox' TaxID=2679914 RepID=UPI0013D61B34|nr:glycosyltransferase family 4 protein [Modicisalibacter sp. 'Wilcox']
MSKGAIAVHQFHHGVDVGDGVTNSLFFIQKLLRSLGFESDIFAVNAPRSLSDRIRPYQALEKCDAERTLLLHHHSMGHDIGAWLESLSLRRALVYHNITPAEFFAPGSDNRHYAELGREQLKQWRDTFAAVLAVSEYNADDLVSLGYARDAIRVIPLLVDSDNLLDETTTLGSLATLVHPALEFRPALAFVGRIVENKRQHLLLEMLWYLHRMLDLPDDEKPMLVLAGGGETSPYGRFLWQRLHQLHLDDSVVICGKIDDATRQVLYRQSAAFVCASAHEGFGMPLVEAMAADCPVVAIDKANVSHTLGEGGLILGEDDPAGMAAAVALLLQDEPLRHAVQEGQRHALTRYTSERLRDELRDWLDTELDLRPPHPAAPSFT